MTLLDGATAQASGFTIAPATVASLRVGNPGDRLQVAQVGLNAYVADATTGTLTRIDGATLAANTVHGLGVGAGVWADAQHVYVTEPSHNQVDVLDPRTLSIRSSVAAHASGAVVDRAGRLWAVDLNNARLLVVDGDAAHHGANVPDPRNAELVIADGSAVLLDIASRTARTVSAGGGLGGAKAIDAAAADFAGDKSTTPPVSGSRNHTWLYAALRSSGYLMTTDVRTGGRWQVSVADPGDDLAPPIESGGMVFVADFTRHTIAIVDVRRHTGRRGSPIPLLRSGFEFSPYLYAAAIYYYDRRGTDDGLIDSAGQLRAAQGTPTSSVPSSRKPTTSSPKSSVTRSTTTSPHPSTHGSSPGSPGGQVSATEQQGTVTTCTTDTFKVTPRQLVSSAIWNFGDRRTAGGTSADHQYGAAGSYTPTVTVTLTSGAVQNIQLPQVTVTACLPHVRVSSGGDGSGPAGDLSVGSLANPRQCAGGCDVAVRPGTKVTVHSLAFGETSDFVTFSGCPEPGWEGNSGNGNRYCMFAMPTTDVSVVIVWKLHPSQSSPPPSPSRSSPSPSPPSTSP